MVYFDHAAATPLNKKALAAMLPYFSERFFNPSAAYLPAHQVREEYEQAKGQIAHAIGAKANDLVMTSGATEANSLALSLMENYPQAKILILETEHPSILKAATKYAHATVKVKRDGVIDLADLRKKLDETVVLLSVALANNELGTIQPLAEIAELIRQERLRRAQSGQQLPLYLHSDASQGLGLLDLNVARLGVDLMTLNSAKVSGPKGVGALYLAHHVKLQPKIIGGGQENGLRAGTENVAGVIGFATALTEAKAHSAHRRREYQAYTEILRQELELATVKPLFLGAKSQRLVNFLPVSFPGLDAERLIYKCEEQELYLSTGAACAASKGLPSHVLRAIGLSDVEIAGSLRISLGVCNDEANVRLGAQILRRAVDEEATRIHANCKENRLCI